jgi:topoisomerase IA-like protein
MRVEEHQGRTTTRTADQVLGEIRDYCRATQTAESTFGRLVVNDGKLVSRLRDGAKITTGTLDKVRAYLSEYRTAPLAEASRPPGEAGQRRRCPDRGGAAGFRFFDNRQYLLS